MKMSEEGMFEKVAAKARENSESYFFIVQTQEDKIEPEVTENYLNDTVNLLKILRSCFFNSDNKFDAYLYFD